MKPTPLAAFFITILASLIMLLPGPGVCQTSQEAHVSGSPNPVGSGARALGMGGAFIGVADDATAASWNPGGLIQLETPEMSIVGSFNQLYEDRHFDQNPGASGKYGLSLRNLNYLSAACPFQLLRKNMIVSLNYQTLYNYNKRHKYNYQYNNHVSSHSDLGPVIIDTATDTGGARLTKYDSDGYLKALSPAIAIQVTPSLSFGITLNYYHPKLGSKWDTSYFDTLNGTLDLEVSTSVGGNPPVTSHSTYAVSWKTWYHDEYRFKTSLNPFGFSKTSYNFGFLWNLNRYLTLGGVYKTPFTAKVAYKETFQSEEYMENVDDPDDATSTISPYTVIADEHQEIDMPASYGLGLACRFSDQFSLALDIYRTDWQDFVLRQASGREVSLITGRDKHTADTKPTHQVRLGGEYLFMLKNKYIVPVRAGLFYDPEPTADEPDDFYGFSLGGGIANGPVVFDLAYQFRWGNNVREMSLGNEVITQDVTQHTVYASLIYHF